MFSLSEERKIEISQTVKQVYEEAELDTASFTSGIVPLVELIKPFEEENFLFLELENMTYQSVAEHLRNNMEKDINLDGDPKKELSGFFCAYKSEEALLDGCILVEAKDTVTRRRFSVAHELGHYVLHFLPQLKQKQKVGSLEILFITEGLTYGESNQAADDSPSGHLKLWDVEAEESQSQTSRTAWSMAQMEEEANFFAAELLMPAVACEALAMRYRRRFGVKREVLAGRLASEFLVSPPAMKRRLKELKLPEKLAA